MLSMAWPRRMNRPSRSYSPVSWISLRSMCTWSMKTFCCSCRVSRSTPGERRFCVSSSAFSSNIMKTPGSPYSTAPCTRNSAASRVLPEPAEPQISVGLPCGKPPPVISSRPWMPVGALAKGIGSEGLVFAGLGVGAMAWVPVQAIQKTSSAWRGDRRSIRSRQGRVRRPPGLESAGLSADRMPDSSAPPSSVVRRHRIEGKIRQAHCRVC